MSLCWRLRVFRVKTLVESTLTAYPLAHFCWSWEYQTGIFIGCPLPSSRPASSACLRVIKTSGNLVCWNVSKGFLILWEVLGWKVRIWVCRILYNEPHFPHLRLIAALMRSDFEAVHRIMHSEAYFISRIWVANVRFMEKVKEYFNAHLRFAATKYVALPSPFTYAHIRKRTHAHTPLFSHEYVCTYIQSKREHRVTWNSRSGSIMGLLCPPLLTRW